VNRHSPERITALEALACYTLGSAYAEFQETEKGSITPGKLADLAVLSGDPTAVAPERIRDLEVQMTIAGGRVVYERETAPSAGGAQ
jgi:predicted amidohydrolase YtcJ